MSEAESAGYQLAHPVYLDVPMMMSFLAHLEGGVSSTEESKATQSDARERAVKAKAGFRARVAPVANVDLSGEGSRQSTEKSSFEVSTARHHTSASLFNALYEYLHEDKKIISLIRADQISGLSSGALVELEGAYQGNPLESALNFFRSFLPYWEEQQEIERAEASKALETVRLARKSSGSAKARAAPAAVNQLEALEGVAETLEKLQHKTEESFGLRMLRRMSEDIVTSPVHDLLFETDLGLKVVCAVASEYYSLATQELLLGGEFHVIGKVTRIIGEEDSLNLARRTVLGAAKEEVVQDLLSGFKSDAIELDIADPIVVGPAVQILPMAIFV